MGLGTGGAEMIQGWGTWGAEMIRGWGTGGAESHMCSAWTGQGSGDILSLDQLPNQWAKRRCSRLFSEVHRDRRCDRGKLEHGKF